MRISDWSSDACSSDLIELLVRIIAADEPVEPAIERFALQAQLLREQPEPAVEVGAPQYVERVEIRILALCILVVAIGGRSEEHTSELQSLMRTSYAVFCLKKQKTYTKEKTKRHRSQ